ncbi:hypothetical protein [Amycolatopsis sp. NPDC004378]
MEVERVHHAVLVDVHVGEPAGHTEAGHGHEISGVRDVDPPGHPRWTRTAVVFRRGPEAGEDSVGEGQGRTEGDQQINLDFGACPQRFVRYDGAQGVRDHDPRVAVLQDFDDSLASRCPRRVVRRIQIGGHLAEESGHEQVHQSR